MKITPSGRVWPGNTPLAAFFSAWMSFPNSYSTTRKKARRDLCCTNCALQLASKAAGWKDGRNFCCFFFCFFFSIFSASACPAVIPRVCVKTTNFCDSWKKIKKEDDFRRNKIFKDGDFHSLCSTCATFCHHSVVGGGSTQCYHIPYYLSRADSSSV